MVSAYCKETQSIVRINVGKRSNKTLNRVLISLKLSEAKKVHRTKQYATNHIERIHLNYRTHLKRLNRRSICFSRSVVMLLAVLKIYLWG